MLQDRLPTGAPIGLDAPAVNRYWTAQGYQVCCWILPGTDTDLLCLSKASSYSASNFPAGSLGGTSKSLGVDPRRYGQSSSKSFQDFKNGTRQSVPGTLRLPQMSWPSRNAGTDNPMHCCFWSPSPGQTNGLSSPIPSYAVSLISASMLYSSKMAWKLRVRALESGEGIPAYSESVQSNNIRYSDIILDID